jgi:hypothetical protein
MGCEFKNPIYVENLALWKKCRDVMNGSEAVKAAGELYLPRLSDQTDPEYSAYKARATFYGATGRTVKGLSGTVLRKPPTIEYPDEGKEGIFKHLGEAGEDINLVIQQLLDEVCGVGRMGVMVDAPEGENADPYVIQYYAENIINWREEMIRQPEGVDGRKGPVRRLTLVVLQEQKMEPDPDDVEGYAVKKVETIRVLRLDSEGLYEQELFEKRETLQDQRHPSGPKKTEWISVGVTQPKYKGGQRLDYIPFLFLNPTGVSAEVEKPPLLELVNMNISHYLSSADLEHGRHFTGLPTLYAAGFDPKETKMRVGSAKAWVTENVGAKAGYIEFGGQGLSTLENALKEKESKMAVLGARLLEEQQANPETATAVTLRQIGEKSILAVIAGVVSDVMTQIVRWIGRWAAIAGSEEGKIELNQVYDVVGIDSFMLTGLMQGLQGGTYSFDSFFDKLQKAGFYPDGWTMDDEKEAIAAGLPQLPAGELGSAGDPTAAAAAGGDATGGDTTGAGGDVLDQGTMDAGGEFGTDDTGAPLDETGSEEIDLTPEEDEALDAALDTVAASEE